VKLESPPVESPAVPLKSSTLIDLCLENENEIKNIKRNEPIIKMELGTQQPIEKEQLLYSAASISLLQQELLSQDDPEEFNVHDDDEDIEEVEGVPEHNYRNQDAFCIGEGIILNNVYRPVAKCLAEKFHWRNCCAFPMS